MQHILTLQVANARHHFGFGHHFYKMDTDRYPRPLQQNQKLILHPLLDMDVEEVVALTRVWTLRHKRWD
jgi:hypothetical protein